ncbi:hypothetical protein Misp03_86840 [Microbispora sp. NBRC 16548]|nr:hypothetical protein Misp03_86840 [Microbispora sp. NBRC 16548]
MLASTMQFTNNNQTTSPPHHQTPEPASNRPQAPAGMTGDQPWKKQTAQHPKAPGTVRFLRTQQCARANQPPPPAFPLREQLATVLTRRPEPADPNNQCSTNERTRQGTFAPEPGMDQTQPSQ